VSLNKVQLIGNLGADPDVKVLQNGGATVAKLSIATSKKWTDNQGQKQEKVEWHRVIAWNKIAESCGKYLKKGRQVYVEGELQTRSWDDQQGQKHYTTEVVASTVQFLGGNPDGRAGAGAPDPVPPGSATPPPTFNQDDAIPF